MVCFSQIAVSLLECELLAGFVFIALFQVECRPVGVEADVQFGVSDEGALPPPELIVVGGLAGRDHCRDAVVG